jgi:hypothetical protein
MRRSAAAVVASILVATTLAGCSDADPAEPYARQGCEAWEEIDLTDEQDVDNGRWALRLAVDIDEKVRPPLASAAKRDDVYADAHEAAVELSGAMTRTATVWESGEQPSESDVTRAFDAFEAMTAACDTVLAD